MSAAIAGSVGGLLAYGIGFMDRVDGQRGWRWIMIIEGLPTFVLGIAVWFWLADEPETAYYLSREEKDPMMHHKKHQINHPPSTDLLHRGHLQALKDWKVWMSGCFARANLEPTPCCMDIPPSCPPSKAWGPGP